MSDLREKVVKLLTTSFYDEYELADQIISLCQPQWISVETRLPDDDCTVLAYHKDWGVRESWLHVDGESIGIGLVNDKATHWQPIPEPPEIPDE